MSAFQCYHATTAERLSSIMSEGLRPNSQPTWFDDAVPYVLLSLEPWLGLNGEGTRLLTVRDPRIKAEYFVDAEGLRWPYAIARECLELLT